MQTPASMVTGIVCAPLGLVLVFTAAITPQWREGRVRLGVAGIGGKEAMLLRSDGLWESCLQVVESELKQCWPVSGPYQRDARVRWARGLVLTSLFLCGSSIVLASIGVRCWMDFPLRNVAGTSGVLIALSGLLSLAALALYAHNLRVLGLEPEPPIAPSHASTSASLQLSLRPAGSLYFGWVGGCVQVLGGAALSLSFKRPHCPPCARPAAQEDAEAYEINC
ncbi:claudin-23 [Megalops cyprinoides]|uniref:claudin-23 n=1 Tax=Megalops cyprinoides TaxID=118141 RepID=UPI00186402BE|nr:claudin-23 [Megalops cyprinoides]